MFYCPRFFFSYFFPRRMFNSEEKVSGLEAKNAIVLGMEVKLCDCSPSLHLSVSAAVCVIQRRAEAVKECALPSAPSLLLFDSHSSRSELICRMKCVCRVVSLQRCRTFKGVSICHDKRRQSVGAVGLCFDSCSLQNASLYSQSFFFFLRFLLAFADSRLCCCFWGRIVACQMKAAGCF